MLPKKYRLPIQAARLTSAKAFSGRYFLIKKAQNQLPHSRVGIIVAKATLTKATARNQLRRAVFFVFEQHPEFLKTKQDILFIAKPPTRSLNGFSEIVDKAKEELIG